MGVTRRIDNFFQKFKFETRKNIKFQAKWKFLRHVISTL